MTLQLLLHIPRVRADTEARLATQAIHPALATLNATTVRVATHTQSDEVLCVSTTTGVSASELRCLRWAVHKRHERDVERVHHQLLCDLRGGDESRVARRKQRERRWKRC